jgi:hypothetical protein
LGGREIRDWGEIHTSRMGARLTGKGVFEEEVG